LPRRSRNSTRQRRRRGSTTRSQEARGQGSWHAVGHLHRQRPGGPADGTPAPREMRGWGYGKERGWGVCQRHGGGVAPGPGANSERKCCSPTESPTLVAANSTCLASAPAKPTACTTHKAEQRRGTTPATSWPLTQLAISQLVNRKQVSNRDQSQSGEHSEQQKVNPPAGFFPLGGRRT